MKGYYVIVKAFATDTEEEMHSLMSILTDLGFECEGVKVPWYDEKENE